LEKIEEAKKPAPVVVTQKFRRQQSDERSRIKSLNTIIAQAKIKLTVKDGIVNKLAQSGIKVNWKFK